MVTTASLLAFLLLGHHPFAEDGGIYAAAIEARMDPSLFPIGHAWVAAHTRFAGFVPAVAWLFQHLHLPLATGLLLLQIAALFATLAAALHLGILCFQQSAGARWGTIVIATAAGLPIAGTSLYLVDPYVTARTLTTPMLLWSLCALLERRTSRAAVLWCGAALLHPLMACWALLPIFFILCQRQRHPARWTAALILLALAMAASIVSFAPPDPPLVHTLAETRSYWFLTQWQWFEWIGAIAPLALLLFMGQSPHLSNQWTPAGRDLLKGVFLAGALALLIAGLFAPTPGRGTLLARLQPLRSFHEIYCVFLTLLGGMCLQWISSKIGRARAILPIVAIGIVMLVSQLSLYPSSSHLEMPWSTPANPWQQAFLWISQNTPNSALFALDANYIDLPGEDAQGFRAIALRSTLPDRAKDGGIASVVPALAPDWQRGVQAQADLSAIDDAQRRTNLLPLGVSWLVLPAQAKTSLACPYRNATVLVCTLD